MPHFKPIKATKYPKKHNSGNVTWMVKIGKRIDGKFEYKRFQTEGEANKFKNDWNLKLSQNNGNALSDLDQVTRHEVLAALAKLEVYGATLNEAVEFFIKFARPEQGKITLAEAVEIFLKAKDAVRRSDHYLTSCKKTYYQPFARAFPNDKLVSDVTPAEAQKYIDAHTKWSAATKASHINYLRTFYNFLIKKAYAKLNPFQHIDKPVACASVAKTLSPADVEKLLQHALDTGYKEECACMVLVFFCGVRVTEVSRLTWENVNLKTSRLTIE